MPGEMHNQTQALAEQIARSSYGRLLAVLSVSLRDVASAEDALAAAFEQALKTWPDKGLPENPEAWLVRVARNRILDAVRHSSVRHAAEPHLTMLIEESTEDRQGNLFKDERLKLLFICAHPAIDETIHTPLMLQTVLGLDAARIGSAFLVAPATMGQRLVRAKTKIRNAGISFDIPDRSHLQDRLSAVLAAIYAAYGTGWDQTPGGDGALAGLAEEALFLGDLLVALMPEEPEAKGLLALMLYTSARERARRNRFGHYIPLDRQDTALWNRSMIARAEKLLMAAAAENRYGRYQLEAAIQSAHTKGRLSGRVNWAAILSLYEGLLKTAPSLGAWVSHAGALARSGQPDKALERLRQVGEKAKTYQPYWASLAYAHAMRGDKTDAAKAYDLAIGLSEDAAVKAYLSDQKKRL